MPPALTLALGALGLAALALAAWLLRPAALPSPAAHVRLSLDEGRFEPLEAPPRVIGLGLSYAAHLAETSSLTTRPAHPPVFDKAWSPTTERVQVPDAASWRAKAEAMQPGLPAELDARGLRAAPLLDYEAELGLVLLEDLDAARLAEDRPPALGFFVANDLSDRALAVLGHGQADPYAWWGRSKGHPGFAPAAAQAWVPSAPVRDGVPDVTLRTTVNGEERQREDCGALLYTTTELLQAALAFAGEPLPAGTWILTGTPGGVAVGSPTWMLRAADLLGLDRFQRFKAVQRRAAGFLQPGDEVVVEAEGLGRVAVRLQAPGHS